MRTIPLMILSTTRLNSENSYKFNELDPYMLAGEPSSFIWIHISADDSCLHGTLTPSGCCVREPGWTAKNEYIRL